MLDNSLKYLILKNSDISYRIEIEEKKLIETGIYLPEIDICVVKISLCGTFGSVKDVITFINSANIMKNDNFTTFEFVSHKNDEKTVESSFKNDLFSMYGWSRVSTNVKYSIVRDIATICSLCLDRPVSIVECMYTMNCIIQQDIITYRNYCTQAFINYFSNKKNNPIDWDNFEVNHYGTYSFKDNPDVKTRIVGILKKAVRVKRNGLKTIMRDDKCGLVKGISVIDVEKPDDPLFMIYDKNNPSFKYTESIEAFIDQSEKLSQKSFRDVPFKNLVFVNGNQVKMVICVGTLYNPETNSWYIGYVGLSGNINKIETALKTLFKL